MPTAVGVVAVKADARSVDQHGEAGFALFLAKARAPRAQGFLVAQARGTEIDAEVGEEI
jgi:hypothetical protein